MVGSKGHNRPSRIVEHDLSKNSKNGLEKGHAHQVKTGEKDGGEAVGSKDALGDDVSHTPNNGVQTELGTDADRSGDETNPIEKDIAEAADKADKEDACEEKANDTDKGSNQQESVDHDQDGDMTADETGEDRPSWTASPEQTDPEDFDSRSFLRSMRDLHARLRSAGSRSEADDQPPGDELKALVQDASITLSNFRNYSVHSQTQMEEMRHEMDEVGHRIARQVQRRAYTSDTKTGKQSENVEERQLKAKLAELNADLARAGEELARASLVSVETEQAAVEASLVAEEATAAAATMQDEYERRHEAELKAKAAEEDRKAAEDHRREQEERRADEERAAAEEKKARLKRQESSQAAASWHKLPCFTYKVPPGKTDQGVGCVVRGDPAAFRDNMLECSVLQQLATTFTCGDHEQLISNIVQISATDPAYTLQKPIYVALPYHSARPFTVREAVVKAETTEGEWTVLNSAEVTFDNLNYKDVKFVQAEVTQFTNLAVVTRFKRDFLHFTKRTRKVVSSLDARITFTVERNTFVDTEHFTLQIQPVETSAVNDLKNAESTCSGLLASSAVVTMEWANETFKAPVTMTLPCPANPVKAKKAAAMRAAKEAKMKASERMTMAEIERANRSSSQKKAAAKSAKVVIQSVDDDEEEDSKRTRGPTKWYMGQYGNNDDDENDVLFLLQQLNNTRWSVVPDVDMQQTKLDLLQLELVKPIESFMVLRTKPTVTDSEAEIMAKAIEKQLSLKLVTVILKQRSEDLSDVTLHVIHPSRADRLTRQLEADGFDDGPDSSAPLWLREGDVLEVGFRGNVKSYDDSQQLEMVYNSPLSSSVAFDVVEVDKFLQRSYSTYKGFVQLFRKVKVVRQKSVKGDDGEVHQVSVVEYSRELLCDMLISVPKSSELATPPPMKAPVTIVNRDDGLGMDTLRHLALELGDEWRKLAVQLNVRRVRVQAIIRNTSTSGRGIDDAKYEMLLTWMKAAPRGINKVQTLRNALMKSGRVDLAQEIVDLWENFCNRKKANDL